MFLLLLACDTPAPCAVRAGFHEDADGDGYGAIEETDGCNPAVALVEDATDCDDTNPGARPAGTESCATPFDDDCDGQVNEDGADGCAWSYADDDGDGLTGSRTCVCGTAAPEGEPDCDDDDDALDCAALRTAEAAPRATLERGYGGTIPLGGPVDGDGDGALDFLMDDTFVPVAVVGSHTLGDAGVATHRWLERAGGMGDVDGDHIADVVWCATENGEYDELQYATFSVSSGPWGPDDATPGAIGAWTFLGGCEYAAYDIPGDLDGDGLDEVAISSGRYDDRTVRFLPAGGSSGGSEDLATVDEDVVSLTGRDDLDGDGTADLLVATETTLAVHPGPVLAATPAATTLSARTTSPTAAGDLDGDGYTDLVVDTGLGVWVVRGPADWAPDQRVEDLAWLVVQEQAQGDPLVYQGDGDAPSELAVAAARTADTQEVAVFLDPRGGVLTLYDAEHLWYVDTDARLGGDRLGDTLLALPDLDGDGADDVAVTVRNPGMVYVLGAL